MSLEQQVTALVASANALTGAVNNKIEGIDQKVNSATTAIPDKIKAEMHKTLWVDSVNGSNNNDGLSKGLPIQSIKSAVDSAPKGAHVVVKLMGQNTYEINEDIDCEGKFILITSDGAVWGEPATRATIRSIQTGWSMYKCGQFITGYVSQIQIGQVNIETVQYTVSKPTYNDYLNSLFSGAAASSQVWLYGCNVTLNNGPLSHQHPNGSFGKLDLYLNTVIFTINEAPTIPGGNAVIMGNYGNDPIPFTLYAAVVVLPAGKVWGELVTANTSAANSNISF